MNKLKPFIKEVIAFGGTNHFLRYLCEFKEIGNLVREGESILNEKETEHMQQCIPESLFNEEHADFPIDEKKHLQQQIVRVITDFR